VLQWTHSNHQQLFSWATMGPFKAIGSFSMSSNGLL
jgi:hypothetical protein